MVTFSRNEIISSSQFVRSFAGFLQRMPKSNDEKIVIVKNNQMQVVMIPIDGRAGRQVQKGRHAEPVQGEAQIRACFRP